MLRKTSFTVAKMDCASEEQIIKMHLGDNQDVRRLGFDVANRKLVVVHESDPEQIAHQLSLLNLDATLIESTIIENKKVMPPVTSSAADRRLLLTVLLINLVFFGIELITGLISRSMALIADSLDMLADALVYGLSLFATVSTTVQKKKVVRISGYFQLTLALLGFAEIVRRSFTYNTPPEFLTIVIVSVFALLANAISLWLLHRSKSNEPYMKASMIFTSNDVVINLGVIAAGVLVYWTRSGIPDLVVGSIVFAIVARGAFRILNLAR